MTSRASRLTVVATASKSMVPVSGLLTSGPLAGLVRATMSIHCPAAGESTWLTAPGSVFDVCRVGTVPPVNSWLLAWPRVSPVGDTRYTE